jgi:hypothetical protein
MSGEMIVDPVRGGQNNGIAELDRALHVLDEVSQFKDALGVIV